ncbi:MAG TPA: anthranilate phosphoribosyltransferase [Dehalococcoidia bacterium]|nr:anthranilate phosphoribosyltransferase [Dehalococcoidia bacterium]
MIREAIITLVLKKSLTFEQAAGAMDEIMSGEATPAQIGAFLTALNMKGETAEEISGLASVMRARATPVATTSPTIDVVGTGGDGSNSFNISTTAAFVVAGAGFKVAKHGNRAASSKCGSADVLEALGVKIELPPEAVSECIDSVGIGFMFAPAFHPAMKYVANPRREIGIRTVFNILGPLTNPAHAEHVLLGVPSETLGNKIAAVLHRLSTRHSLVVHSRDGMDEISISGPSVIWDVSDEPLSEPYEVFPYHFGFQKAPQDELRGGTPKENAAVLRRILGGEKSVLRNVIVMNAAAALVAGNLTEDLKEAAHIAEDAIDSGRAAEKLNKLIEKSQKLG